MKRLRQENLSCGGPTRSSRPRACFSRPSSTQTGRSERVHRPASRALRRRAHLPDAGRLRRARTGRGAAARRSRRGIDDEQLRRRHPRAARPHWYAYGYRRVWLALRRDGRQVGRDRVRRLMRQHGIEGAKRRSKRWRTTRPDVAAARRATSSNATSAQIGRTPVGRRSDLPALAGRASPIWPSCSMPTAAARRLAAGHELRTSLVLDALRMAVSAASPARTSSRAPLRRRRAVRLPRVPAGARRSPACWPRIGSAATPTTMPWPRASSTRSRPN